MAVLPGGRPSGPAQAVGNKLAASGALGPEGQAAAAASGGGTAGGRSRRPRRITSAMSSAEVTDELQARRSAAATPGPAGEPSSPADPGTTPTAPAPPSSGAGPSAPRAFTDQAGAPGWWAPLANPGASAQAAANAGGGFLLGLFGWALGLAYLRGRAPEVRKFMAAKFLNKT